MQDLTYLDFDRVTGEGTVIVDMWANWCAPCRKMHPIFEELESEFEGVTFARVDIEAYSSIAEACDVTSIPSFIVFRDGEVIDTVRGAAAKDSLRDAFSLLTGVNHVR